MFAVHYPARKHVASILLLSIMNIAIKGKRYTAGEETLSLIPTLVEKTSFYIPTLRLEPVVP